MFEAFQQQKYSAEIHIYMHLSSYIYQLSMVFFTSVRLQLSITSDPVLDQKFD